MSHCQKRNPLQSPRSKQRRKRGLTTLTALFTFLLAAPGAQARETVQVKVDEAVHVKKLSHDLLVVDSLLPAGSVIEVPIDSYRRAETLPYWKGDDASSMAFVKDIKVIKAPGFSEGELKELNAWRTTEGLFVAKKQIADAVVIETPSSASITLRHPTPVLRNDGPEPTVPNVKESLSVEDAERIVDQIQQTNATVKGAGRTQTMCPACDGEMARKWIKAGVPARALNLALDELHKNPRDAIKNKRYVTIADFTKSSDQKRLFILDTKTGEMQKLYTSHGRGSDTGKTKAGRFGDRNSSHQTPAGFLVTGTDYHFGKHGKSLVLEGLEARNKNAAERKIEIHKADYARESFVKKNGFTGRSWGCDAIDPSKIDDVLAKLKGGSLVYHYTGD